MIRAEGLGFKTTDTGMQLLKDISLHVKPGERVGIIGPSGAGKTTLALHLAGLHNLALLGRTTGTLWLNGNDCTRSGSPGFAGVVLQNPEIQLFEETVEEEIRLSLQNRVNGCDRIEEELERFLAIFELQRLRSHKVATLSLGWKQRLAISSMLALKPGLLLLDEPTSFLDEIAANQLFAMLTAQSEQSGLAVLVIEHDLPLLLPWATRILALQDGQITFDGPPNAYSPKPILTGPKSIGAPARNYSCALTLEHVGFAYASQESVLEDVSFSVSAGEMVALVGPNGSGKSTLLNLIKGLLEPQQGRIMCADQGPRMETVGLAFQNPDDQLFAHSVFEECAFLPRNLKLSEKECASRTEKALADMGLQPHLHRVPFTLSYGEKRRLTLASTLSGQTALLCLDEPTVGLDGASLEQLAVVFGRLCAAGGAVLFATHDLAFAKTVATRIVSLRSGHIADDTTLRSAA